MNRKLARKASSALILAALLLCLVAPASADPGALAAEGWLGRTMRWVEQVWAWWIETPTSQASNPVVEKSGSGGQAHGGGGGSHVNSCSGYTSDPDGCPGSS